MAYTLINSQTLLNPTATVTFSGIPATFKDLCLEITGYNATVDGVSHKVAFNNDTAFNYSLTFMYGTGTSAVSSRRTTANSLDGIFIGYGTGWSTTSTNICTTTMNILSYANTSIYKTALSRQSSPSGSFPGTESLVGLWQSTAAINSLTVIGHSGATFATGSTFKLWGVS